MSGQTALNVETKPLPPFTFADFKTTLRHAADDLGLKIFDTIESKDRDYKPFWNDDEKVDSLTAMDIVLEMEEILDRDPRFGATWDAIDQNSYDVYVTLGDLYEKVCKAGKIEPIY